ncbi:UNVERIFIED_CONTAM: hypothetical protein FKN15_074392 [Acipenser sinensis]
MPNHSASIQVGPGLSSALYSVTRGETEHNTVDRSSAARTDPNVIQIKLSTVKYLGLLAMSKILKTHPKSVQSHKDLILQCLDDKDESIRLRALDLLYGMVSTDRTPKLTLTLYRQDPQTNTDSVQTGPPN